MSDSLATISQHIKDNIQTQQQVLAKLPATIKAAGNALVDCLHAGNKILCCGNGGSAADAQHFAAELTGRFERERRPLAGMALTTDTSALTAIGNDYSFAEVFSKQIAGLGKSGDILLALSTSGNSKNTIQAIKIAQIMHIRVIALTGKGGGNITDILQPKDVHICIPAERTCRIQEAHILTLHILCDYIDNAIIG